MNVAIPSRALGFTWLALLLVAGAAAALHGCTDPNPRVIYLGTGATSGSGGVTSSGGVVGTGGVTAGSGGVVGSGGVTTTGSGGAAGGATATGGAAGGASATGGAAAGASGSGGATPAGGATGSGGAIGTGGAGQMGGASGGPNLLGNGDFSMGDMMWSVDNSSVSHQVMNGQFCLLVSANTPSFHLGWPAMTAQALRLMPGMYRLSYKASSTGPLNVSVQPKVGLAVDPYTADFPTGSAVTDPVGATAQTFTHNFTTTMTDAQAGVAFTVAPGNNGGMTTVCFDDVSLQQL